MVARVLAGMEREGGGRDLVGTQAHVGWEVPASLSVSASGLWHLRDLYPPWGRGTRDGSGLFPITACESTVVQSDHDPQPYSHTSAAETQGCIGRVSPWCRLISEVERAENR